MHSQEEGQHQKDGEDNGDVQLVSTTSFLCSTLKDFSSYMKEDHELSAEYLCLAKALVRDVFYRITKKSTANLNVKQKEMIKKLWYSNSIESYA